MNFQSMGQRFGSGCHRIVVTSLPLSGKEGPSRHSGSSKAASVVLLLRASTFSQSFWLLLCGDNLVSEELLRECFPRHPCLLKESEKSQLGLMGI